MDLRVPTQATGKPSTPMDCLPVACVRARRHRTYINITLLDKTECQQNIGMHPNTLRTGTVTRTYILSENREYIGNEKNAEGVTLISTGRKPCV